MERMKRFAVLVLCLALLCTVLPQMSPTANAVTYTELGTISTVQATGAITAPTLGADCARPKFTVTDPTDKNASFGMVIWQKKAGSGWIGYYDENFEEGTYRLKVQLRTDHFADNTYYRLTNDTKLYINGTAWTKCENLQDTYSSSGYGVMYFCSREYELKVPAGCHSVTVTNDGHGRASASPVYGAPGDVITLSATPNQFYQFKNWQVFSGGVTVIGNKFTMGNQDVVVSAIFEPDNSLDLGTIPEVRATASINNPVIGEDIYKARPNFSIELPVGKNVDIPRSMESWEKLNGSYWERYTKNSFEAGTYRLKVQLRTDHFDDGTYYRLTNDTKLFVNGSEWTKVGDLQDTYSGSGYGVMYFASQAFTAKPEAYFQISFDPNGGIMAPLIVTTNKYGKLDSHPTITREGYEFRGWFTDPVYGVKVTTDTVFDANATIYAHWIKPYHGITVRSGTADRFAAPEGMEIVITANKKDGYSFAYWQVVTGGVTLADRYCETTTFTMGTQDVTVAACYNSDSSTVNDVYIYVDEPVAGAHPAEAVTTEALYRVSQTKWIDVETGTALAATDTFRAGKSYRLSVHVQCNDHNFPFNISVLTGYVNDSSDGVTATPKGMSVAQLEKDFTARRENPFVDVHESDWFFNPVMWAYYDGITGGTDETHFSPHKTVLRSDAMVFFWAANGRPTVEAESNPFRDVSDKHWAHKAVMWAVKNQITGGTKPDEFSPSKTCSRSEILQFLYASMGKPEYTIENPYSDINTNQWYYDGAIWAYENGLEKGENGMFNAATPCNRGYVVTYLYRFVTGNELDE